MRQAELHPRPDPATVQDGLRKNAARHAAARKRKLQQFSKSQRFAAVRLREIGSVLESRHGYTLPDDDAGREYLEIVVQHIRGRHPGKPVQRAIAWASLRAPWATEIEVREIAERAIAKPIRWKADELADELGVTLAERGCFENKASSPLQSQSRRASRQDESGSIAKEG